MCFTEVKLTIADEISSLFGRGRFVSKYAVSIFLKQINGGLEPTSPVTNIQLLCISLRNVHSRSRSIETFATFASNILQISPSTWSGFSNDNLHRRIAEQKKESVTFVRERRAWRSLESRQRKSFDKDSEEWSSNLLPRVERTTRLRYY